MESFGFLCVCISRDYGAASVMANSIITFWNLSCGFLINPGIPLFPLPPFSFLLCCSLTFSSVHPLLTPIFRFLSLSPSTSQSQHHLLPFPLPLLFSSRPLPLIFYGLPPFHLSFFYYLIVFGWRQI